MIHGHWIESLGVISCCMASDGCKDTMEKVNDILMNGMWVGKLQSMNPHSVSEGILMLRFIHYQMMKR